MKPANIYYYANQIYQSGHALPLYKAMGGIFILKKIKRVFEFKKYTSEIPLYHNEKSLLNTPRFIVKNIDKVTDLEGVIISLSNTAISCDPGICKTIYIGHGMGDKKFGEKNTNNQLEKYDYHFISGPKHLEKLKDSGAQIPDSKFIKIGNLGFDEYVDRKDDRDSIFQQRGISEPQRKNILFAPTWEWGGGTLQKYVYDFATELTKDFNLIVRPHSHDRKYIPKIKSWAKREGINNIYFSDSTNLIKYSIMDDFLISDLMISDTSSILYEYLITKKPIIIVKNDSNDLHHMPDDMNIIKYASVYNKSTTILSLLSENLFGSSTENHYAELLNNCFYFNDGKSVQRAMEFINSL